jgi:hypothetical protein
MAGKAFSGVGPFFELKSSVYIAIVDIMLGNSIAKFFKVDSLISNLTGYVETRIELLKVEAKEEMSKGLAKVILFLLLAFVFALVLIFISIGLALVLTEKIGAFAGFGIVAGVYLVVGVVLLLTRENLTKNLEGMIKEMLSKKK